MIRSFIAFDLENEDTIENIKNFSERIIRIQPNLKLIKSENIHLTIKFLGDIKESIAPLIYNILDKEINKKFFSDKPYIFKLENVGNFKNYSIIWINLEGYTDLIQEIKDIVEEKLHQKQNIKKDQRQKFNPHITIARLNRKKINYKTFSIFKKEIIKNKNKEFGEFYIKKIKLKKSVLTPKGPIYSELVY
ncbi:MAG: RNA 2',3'-cyclic phosphodiesterase [Candidatus Lokiarchaeota archaeon]|nr:RNA 2',3'-cyclic phosphodiesterase [Candidatus Lokiarchaeota archaeon]